MRVSRLLPVKLHRLMNSASENWGALVDEVERR